MYKVLIVEDDPMVAMINEQYVKKHKNFFVAGKCKNGKDAVAFLRKEPVDLVIMDVYMPVQSGIETLHKIREENIPVSVIMVTAANDSATFEEAMRYGAVDYLVKPFAYERFHQALERFVSNSAVLAEGRALNQKSIDRLVGSMHEAPKTAEAPKGIQEKTRDKILDCLAESDDWMTGEEISEIVGLSAVTVRRYMNHLVQTGEIIGEMNYETGGRPCMLYRLEK